MFQGKSFSTMTLTPNGSGFTGSVTESRISPKQIPKAELEGSMLRVKFADDFEFTMVLKDDTRAPKSFRED